MIVIPMVGKSSRFFNAGYNIPKYMLPLKKSTVFKKVLQSFKGFFHNEKFIFLVRSDFNAKDWVEGEVRKLGIKDYEIKVFDQETRGQAETVFLGLKDKGNKDEPLLIFNIDTFRPNFKHPTWVKECDGYLEVFEGNGDNWSFVKSGMGNSVIETTEKVPISNLCSDGIYYFGKKSFFDRAFQEAQNTGDMFRGEYYIAPLYNRLINKGLDIRYSLIDKGEVIFCGTPEEYEECQNSLI